jgi:hypothetical protein
MAFLVGILIILFLEKQDPSFLGYRSLSSASPAQMDLNAFARNGPEDSSSKKMYSFSEESAVSMTHRYNGKFDTAILRWDTGPVLVALIERKFPRSILPERAKLEDIFQASLYSLALKEKGISCTSTQLIVVYCLQETAIKCLKKQGGLDCFRCKEGKVFKTRYNEKKTMKLITKLDEVWYEGRKPRPYPSLENCRVCPFSKKDKCKYSAV